jgi:hypothetical protein
VASSGVKGRAGLIKGSLLPRKKKKKNQRKKKKKKKSKTSVGHLSLE